MPFTRRNVFTRFQRLSCRIAELRYSIFIYFIYRYSSFERLHGNNFNLLLSADRLVYLTLVRGWSTSWPSIGEKKYTREQLLVESWGASRARTPFRNPAAVFLTANRNTSSSSPPQPELVGNASRSSGTAMSNLCSIKNSPWRKGTSERGRNLLLATSLRALLEVFPIDSFFHSVSRDCRGKM